MPPEETSPLILIPMPHTYLCGAFDCGVQTVNDALRGELLHALREGRVRAYYVELDGDCAGFIALRAESFELTDSIDRERYSPPLSRTRVPGVLLELLGVDRRFQGQGLGEQLLLAAVKITQQVSSLIAARFLVLESLPDAVRFYRRLGFEPTIKQPDRRTVFLILDLL